MNDATIVTIGPAPYVSISFSLTPVPFRKMDG